MSEELAEFTSTAQDKADREESDDAMTIIAALVEMRRPGDAAKIALIQTTSIVVQLGLLVCIAWHTADIRFELDPGETENFMKPPCNETNPSPDPSECLNKYAQYKVKLGCYFAIAGLTFYFVQDQFATSLPSQMVLLKRMRCRWFPIWFADTLVSWAIYFIGVFWLSITQSVEDLVLNSVALLFIAEIDDQCIKIAKRFKFAAKFLKIPALKPLEDGFNDIDDQFGGCVASCFAFPSFLGAVLSPTISVLITMASLKVVGRLPLTFIDAVVFVVTFIWNCALFACFLYDTEQDEDDKIFSNEVDAEDLPDEHDKELMYDDYDSDRGYQ